MRINERDKAVLTGVVREEAEKRRKEDAAKGRLCRSDVVKRLGAIAEGVGAHGVLLIAFRPGDYADFMWGASEDDVEAVVKVRDAVADLFGVGISIMMERVKNAEDKREL